LRGVGLTYLEAQCFDEMPGDFANDLGGIGD
jgi:hypothetical protein